MPTLGGIVCTGIIIAHFGTELKKKLMEFVIPVAGSLFEPIKSLSKKANIMRMIGVDKAFRLLHVKDFSNVAMQKCSFDVKLNNLEVISSSNSHDNGDSFKFDHKGEGFIVINPNLLSAALCK